MSFQTLEHVAARTRVVRVDLLPPEFAEVRRTRRLRLALGAGLLGVVAVTTGAGVLTAGHVGAAEESLAVEQARTEQLQAAQRPYAEVPQVLAEVRAVQAVQAEVSATDVPWYAYLDRLATGAPDRLRMTSVRFATGADATAGTATPGIGRLTVTGETVSAEKVADWMDQVAAVPGLADPVLVTMARSAENGVVTFTASATVTADATRAPL